MTANDTKAPIKPRWTAPTLTYVSRLDQLVQGGTGKVTVEIGDPGEPKKVQSKG
jgi:hypothetical protein